jgi:hypothetical protein
MLSEAAPCLSDVKGDWIFDMPEATQAANLVSGLSRDCLSGVAIAPVTEGALLNLVKQTICSLEPKLQLLQLVAGHASK